MAMSRHIVNTCSGIFQLIDSISLIFQHFHGQRKKQRKKHTQAEKVREQKKRKKEIISIFNSRNIAYTDPSSNFFSCLRHYFFKNIYRAPHDVEVILVCETVNYQMQSTGGFLQNSQETPVLEFIFQ